jgi:hypothetical protein
MLKYGDKTIFYTYSSQRAKKDEAERSAKVEKEKLSFS